MSFWNFVQLSVDLVLLSSIGYLAFRHFRQQKDDPRLSKGLQLLQTKISILEDLSDRTESQVNQMNLIVENSGKEISKKIHDANITLSTIEADRRKSLEAVKLLQDLLPDNQIRDRQKTVNYIQAAKLANKGLTKEDIAAQVDLSSGELDFVIKVNKDHLMFCENSLPDWVQQIDLSIETLTNPLIDKRHAIIEVPKSISILPGKENKISSTLSLDCKDIGTNGVALGSNVLIDQKVYREEVPENLSVNELTPDFNLDSEKHLENFQFANEFSKIKIDDYKLEDFKKTPLAQISIDHSKDLNLNRIEQASLAIGVGREINPIQTQNPKQIVNTAMKLDKVSKIKFLSAEFEKASKKNFGNSLTQDCLAFASKLSDGQSSSANTSVSCHSQSDKFGDLVNTTVESTSIPKIGISKYESLSIQNCIRPQYHEHADERTYDLGSKVVFKKIASNDVKKISFPRIER